MAKKHNQSSNLAVAQVTAKLGKLSALLDDMSPIMAEIAAILKRDATEAFQNEWNPSTHEKWADLDEKTIAGREKINKWPGHKLQVEGELVKSLSSDYGSKFARVGLTQDYAPAHQFGRPDKNLPARPFLPFDGLHPDTEQAIIDFLTDKITEALR